MKRIAFIKAIHLDDQFPLDKNVIPRNNFKIILSDIENREIKDIVFGGDIGEPTSYNILLRINICGESRQLGQARNRYLQELTDSESNQLRTVFKQKIL